MAVSLIFFGEIAELTWLFTKISYITAFKETEN